MSSLFVLSKRASTVAARSEMTVTPAISSSSWDFVDLMAFFSRRVIPGVAARTSRNFVIGSRLDLIDARAADSVSRMALKFFSLPGSPFSIHARTTSSIAPKGVSRNKGRDLGPQ